MLALMIGALWAVAPALSSRPYAPRAVDFTQPLAGKVERTRAHRVSERPAHSGAGLHAGHEPVRFRTAPIRAPRRFDLVGVAGETAALELRTRLDGAGWSDWVETTDGNPVWAGGADLVQIRSRGKRISGHLHYVNVTGTDTALRRVLTGIRSAVSSVVGTTLATAEAEAARAIRYVPRSAWGAERKKGGCRPRVRPSEGEIKLAAVHHTVTTNDYGPELGPSVVLGICRYHRNANGWNDIGYNALIDRYGRVYEGRAGGLNRSVIGAHAAGWNSLSFGVALIGNHTSERPRGRAVAKLAKLLAWKLTLVGQDKAKGRRWIRSLGGSGNRYPRGRRVRLHRLLTHRHLSPTSCAGDATEPLMRKIRQRVQNKLDRWQGDGPAIIPTEGDPPPEPPAEPPTGEPGDPPAGQDPPPDGGTSPEPGSGGTPTGGVAYGRPR